MKLIPALALAAVAVSVVGCKSTMDDRWRSDMRTTLEDAHFRPVYEVQKNKGIVSGQAEETYSWWGIFGTAPDTYANELGGPLTLKPGVKEAAFADACKKANCQILLAPRFTVTKETGFLWFCGRTKAVVEGGPAVLKTAEEIPLEKWVEYQSKLAPCKCSSTSIGGIGLPALP